MNHTKQTVKLFWEHARRYPAFVAGLATVFPILVLLRDIMQPFIIAEVLSKISSHNYNHADLWASFGGYIIVFATIVLFTDILGWRLMIWMIWKLEMRVQQDLANRIFNHLTNMSAGFHANRFGGSLVSQTNKLVGAYVRFADTTVFNVGNLIIMTVLTVAVLTPRAPGYVAALLVLMALYIVGALILSKPIQAANTKEASQESKQTGYLADSISNIMAVKSFAGETYETKRFFRATEETRLATLANMRATQKRDLFASSITGGLTFIALLIAVFGSQWFKADIATLFLIVSYTGTLGQRLWDFNGVLRNYNRAIGDASDMTRILQIEPEIKDVPGAAKLRVTEGGIVFDNMTFSHADAGRDETLFNNLDLTIKPGEKIGLVGHSGSGKTTLTKLLLRFSDIDSGKILIDGQDISQVAQADLRRHIAYVPQEPLLFHRSIRENIAYGNPKASMAEIRKAAKSAHAAEFIEKLGDGYDTLVGERGVKLSGGQRQRIAIARAMLKNAPILLLDEATSALDSESEKLIQDALWELMKGRTAIVIAHRLSTVQKMDRIIVLEDGKIVEQGSHTELAANNGIYSELWKHQSGGFLDD